LPISGDEDPLNMYWGHRADYLKDKKNENGQYVHFNLPNKPDEEVWNTLWLCFLPPRYSDGAKVLNAYLHSKVNEQLVFEGQLKSGTRASRKTSTQDPETRVYKFGEGDLKIRILGHWGSLVKFKDIKIRSVGSTP
jgi:hypothetical protein